MSALGRPLRMHRITAAVLAGAALTVVYRCIQTTDVAAATAFMTSAWGLIVGASAVLGTIAGLLALLAIGLVLEWEIFARRMERRYGLRRVGGSLVIDLRRTAQ